MARSGPSGCSRSELRLCDGAAVVPIGLSRHSRLCAIGDGGRDRYHRPGVGRDIVLSRPGGSAEELQHARLAGQRHAERPRICLERSTPGGGLRGGGLESGEQVPGRTGIKSSTKHAFLGGWADGRTFGGMLGRPRQLPLYESAEGNGENAVFTLSRFVAVHVMALKIGGRWRTQYSDTEGDEIEAVKVQPLRSTDDLIQVQLVR